MIQRSALVKWPLIPLASSMVTLCSHLSAAQNNKAVKKDDKAYTSPSTALYQNESEKV